MTEGSLLSLADSSSSGMSLAGEVIQILRRYEGLLKERNFAIPASRENFLRIRSELPETELAGLHGHLAPFLSAAEEFMALPNTFRERHQELPLLRHFLQRSGLTPSNGLERLVDETDVIEVYDQKAIQCYRSFNFFDICSYSLEEIFTYPWWNLYERNPFVTRRIANICLDIFNDRASDAVAVDVPDHIAKEIWSPLKSTVRIRQKWIVPLRNEQGRATHCLANFAIIERL